ncbi:SMI1/KNR4 family protein [Flavobacterium hungaricum]|uniref:SMI1/KNR4 family protein n=1 Tax=Flavobacterium hungaricum TaxID=2082725 RepID=A0ABR9TJH1_9FLAO|nr:SMI1/KNR4 family protein [Flavobacterium hungaricum]MBE8725172.1 SMI1/KNR4 family protein [Flavobacterium hungaricum]
MPFPIDEKYIIESEEELGLEFPLLFKEKMIVENGGEVVTEDDNWNLYPFFDKSDQKRISRTCNHLILETKQAKEWSNFPPHAVAVAGNGCGDYLLLLAVENTKQLGEKIYLWRHETGDFELVAENLKELTAS